MRLLRNSTGPYLTALAGVLAGCTLEPLPEEAACGPSRRSVDGACCPVFTRATALGCVPRDFAELATLGDGQAAALSVAVDGHGRIGVGWVESNRAVVAEEDQPGAFGPTVALSAESDGVAGQVDLAEGPDGEALVAWRTSGGTSQGSTVWVAERAANAAWADRGLAVSFDGGGYEPRVGIGSEGDRALIWNQWDGAHYGVALATSDEPGAPWSLPVRADDVLSPAVNFSNAPRLAVGPAGELVITWYQANATELMTFVSERKSRSSTATRPGIDEYLSAPGAPVDSHPISNPKVALGPSGQAAVAWTQEDGRGHVAAYLATRDAAGRWYRPRDLEDAIGTHWGVARCAELAFGAQGDLFVVFEQDGASMLSVRGSDGTWLTPRGSPRQLSGEGVLGLDPHVASGTDGAVVIVFRELDGAASRLLGLRLTSGSVDLDRPIETLATGSGFASPVLAIGGPDDRIVVGVVEHGTGVAHVRLLSLD